MKFLWYQGLNTDLNPKNNRKEVAFKKNSMI